MTRPTPPPGIGNARTRRHSIPAAQGTSMTFNVGTYLHIQNTIRQAILNKELTHPSKIFLKIGDKEIIILKPHQNREAADVVLHITPYKKHLEAIKSGSSEVARYILAQRGYGSIPLVTYVEINGKIAADIKEGILGAAQYGNELALEHIHQELLSSTPFHEYKSGQSPAYQGWFSERMAWAREHDKKGAIFQIHDSRSFSISGLDQLSLSQLNIAFSDAAQYFRSEDSAKQVAPTAFRDVHEAVQEANVGMIKEILGRLKPGQNVVYLQVLDPNSGAIAQVHSREMANIALYLGDRQSNSILITYLYLRPEVLKSRLFFEEIVNLINNNLNKEVPALETRTWKEG